jgi:hypothetical protein
VHAGRTRGCGIEAFRENKFPRTSATCMYFSFFFFYLKFFGRNMDSNEKTNNKKFHLAFCKNEFFS